MRKKLDRKFIMFKKTHKNVYAIVPFMQEIVTIQEKLFIFKQSAF